MSLISDVNEFLDKISYDFSNIYDNIVEIHLALSNNFEKLKSFRQEMDFYGFQNPYYVIKGVRDSWKDPFFRQTATKKKITFDRIQYSIAAHRIALEHLNGAVEVRINKKRLTGEKAIVEIINNKMQFSLNPDGVYNFDVISNLPFGGQYMLMLSNLSKQDRLSYRKVVGALGKRNEMESGVSPVFMYKKGSSISKKKFTMLLDTGQDPLFRKKHRKSVAQNIELNRQQRPLILDKYIRKCIGVGYAPLSYYIFIRDLLKFYLKKSRYERERHSSIFPGISADPDKKLFGKFEKAISKKEELERKLEKLKVHEKSPFIGAVAFYMVCKDKQETEEMFNISFSKVKRALERLEKLGLLGEKHLINKRTQKFLEFLKTE
ncbi:MAG: DUF530 family protein [Candidatus Methanofastidiosia archaeon]